MSNRGRNRGRGNNNLDRQITARLRAERHREGQFRLVTPGINAPNITKSVSCDFHCAVEFQQTDTTTNTYEVRIEDCVAFVQKSLGLATAFATKISISPHWVDARSRVTANSTPYSTAFRMQCWDPLTMAPVKEGASVGGLAEPNRLRLYYPACVSNHAMDWNGITSASRPLAYITVSEPCIITATIFCNVRIDNA